MSERSLNTIQPTETNEKILFDLIKKVLSINGVGAYNYTLGQKTSDSVSLYKDKDGKYTLRYVEGGLFQGKSGLSLSQGVKEMIHLLIKNREKAKSVLNQIDTRIKNAQGFED